MPLVLLGLVVAHLIALHEVGSNNPDGVEIKDNEGRRRPPARRHPVPPVLHGARHLSAWSVFLIVFCAVLFFAPEMGGYFLEYNNFIPADPLKTPPHIAPVWYFTPFYSMLRATTDDMMVDVLDRRASASARTRRPAQGALRRDRQGASIAVVALVGIGGDSLLRTFDAKFWGVLVMGGAVVILFFLPWLDRSPVKSIRYRPGWHKYVYGVFVVIFLVLGYLGIAAADRADRRPRSRRSARCSTSASSC